MDVSANAVLTLLELSKQPSSRVRVALRDVDVERGLQKALTSIAENKQDGLVSIKENIVEALSRIQL
jgi:hypothetical protein